MISLRMLLTCFWSLSLLAIPITSRAEIVLSFIPTEEAKFLIKGEGYEGVVSLHLTVDYNITGLSAPEVTIMGGTLLQDATLDKPPGRLHLTIQTEEHSPVFEACVFFQKPGDFPAVINIVTAEMTDPGGTRQPIAVVMLPNPNLPQPYSSEPVEGTATADQGLQDTQDAGSKR